MSEIISHSVSRVQGEYTPPGDKSISHRLVMLGALADGASEFSHFLEADDCLRTIEAFRSMGVSFDRTRGKTAAGIPSAAITVKGVGMRGLSQPKSGLDLGNSGTTMRLLLGILAGQPFEARLSGDDSLTRRPMSRVTRPLRKMGARITGREDANFAPLVIQGGRLTGIEWQNEIASAQVKSAILFAGLFAEGKTEVREAIPSRDHTERLLARFGAPVRAAKGVVTVERAERLEGIRFEVPGDFSSAAFFIAAALLVPGSELKICRVGLNPTRIGLLEALKSMGADAAVEKAEDSGEPAGHIRVKAGKLKGIQIDQKLIPSLIDELPILMILCALADGTSVIRGASELRVKETDRIHSMAAGLAAIGGKIEERPDGCVIEGVPEFSGGEVTSFGDHRTAMSFAVAGLRSKREVVVRDTGCIQTSYPRFWDDLTQIAVS